MIATVLGVGSRMETKRKPMFGDTLYMVTSGRRLNGPVENEYPVTVIKVGRKFFTVVTTGKWPMEVQFHLEDWKQVTEYMPTHYLYESKEVYNLAVKRASMMGEVTQFFREYSAYVVPKKRLSDTQLETIYNIVMEVTNENTD